MDKYKKLAMIMCSVGLMFLLTGITYSFFNYTRTGDDNVLVTGDIYMHLDEGQDEITLANIFPETANEARARNDNTITFTLNGLNESNRDIYYEIDLIHGSDLSGYTRFNDSDLVFDLIEVGSNNEETYLINSGSYDDLTNRRIWVDTVDGGTTTEIEKTYKLRMWLSENVIISDTDPNANYPATGANAFKNHYASVKVRVIGDFTKKEIPSAYTMLRDMADTTTLINFASKSSSTNGQGLYILKGTENDQYPIAYFRGDVSDNNVVFGGFCWQIVRTTDTGGIKMIYNGLPDVSGSGENITYNCGITRDFQNTIMTTTSLDHYTGYYYADDYEIVSTEANSITYRLKAGPSGIHQVAITNATVAASEIPTIASNYPYTCKKTTPDATCEKLYIVDSYASGTKANVFSSLDRTTIGRSAFNINKYSVSDVGYMSNERFPGSSSNWTESALFASSAIWTGTYYELTDADVRYPDSTHHYSCNATTSDATCTSLRYVYYTDVSTKYYITLTNGDLIEDALYKMTGNGSTLTKTKNAGYNLNVNNSTVKTVIDNWFRTNLTDEINGANPNYGVYLEDTVFCNDRSYKTTGSSNTFIQSFWTSGTTGTYLYFGAYNRFSNSWYSMSNVPAVKNEGEIPNIMCPNEIDRFTVSSTNGNGALTYPIGLLTADEVVLAGVGGNNASTTTYYLFTNDYYWSLTPARYSSQTAYEFNTSFGDLYGFNVDSSENGIRPVISLKLGVEFESGDGTPTNPYVVKYN